MNLHIVGIDPGDRWIGWSSLDITGRRWTANCGVIDGQRWQLSKVVDELRPAEHRAIIAMEEYRQRPLGHQAFHRSLTAEYIGAFRYVSEIGRHPFALLPASNVEKLEDMPIAPILRAWRERGWLNPRAPNWRHARSAWLVVCNYLMKEQPQALAALIDPRVALNSLVIHQILDTPPNALTAMSAVWRTL
jgi:hypothetical protein